MRDYFPRQLALADLAYPDRRIDETALLALKGNKIILGEPGMGKSELMRELGRQLGIVPVTAIRFINAKRPEKLLTDGKPLLIDGLDEALSRRDGDAVDAILAQLEESGSPHFILSCRVREWQARGATNLRQLYGDEPSVLTLEPFERSEAHAYLLRRHFNVDAQHVLDHLSSHNLEELYRNPLTLGLMGRVAATDKELPATRAGLFERVSSLIWPEHDPDRQDDGLAQLSEDEALDAAGAISAALLLAGGESASTLGAAVVHEGDLRLADLEGLTSAKAARAIYSSKLFRSVSPGRAKPIHRVIAEYLGARWLARRAGSARTRRRVLAQMQGSGGVPSSLRGLHAWLAYHSPEMAEQVIAEDPFGVLRYGETTTLSPRLSDCLLNALCKLADDDPYFRSQDWDSKTAAGLMVPALGTKIGMIIGSSTSNDHLRSLLIEGLVGTPLAADLADSLETVLLSPERFYRERDDAASALLPYRGRAWWQSTIATLTAQGGDDAPRLARQIIQYIDLDVSDSQLVETVFAELGVTSCTVPRRRGRRPYTFRSFERLLDAISPSRLSAVLDLVADYAGVLRSNDQTRLAEIADISAHLIVRAIDSDLIRTPQAASLWQWLEMVEKSHRSTSVAQTKLKDRLTNQHNLRQAVQTYVLANERRKDGLYVTNSLMQRRLVGLTGSPDDIVHAFNDLARRDIRDPDVREDWKDLVFIGKGNVEWDAAVLAAAEAVRGGDQPLFDFLRKIESPKAPAWEVRQKKEALKRARKRKVDFEKARRELAKDRDDLCAGKLTAILRPARVYFDRFSDLPSGLAPDQRIAAWIGIELRDDALVGFEAVLHRDDLPTAAEIAGGFACGTTYNYSFPIMAGLYERIRSGKGLADLPFALKHAALLLAYDDHGWKIDTENEALCRALEAEVIPTFEARRSFAQIWIEPALAAGNMHVGGLYKLAHDPAWQPIGAALAAGWLTAFPKAPAVVESRLIDCLTYGGAREALRQLAEARAAETFRDFEHMLSWLAVDILVRFATVRTELEGIGADHPEFLWSLRDRVQFERRGQIAPLSAAQAEWIIMEFRQYWPYAVLQGSGSGNTNDYDATDFLRSLINRVADDTSDGASDAMARLVAGPNDSYSDLIRHMAAEQKQKRAEEAFSALAPGALAALLYDGPPGNIDDLKALVVEEMDIACRKLIGDDLDTVVEFWSDSGIPRDENRCRDRLAAMISPELTRYGIQRLTEADMPQTKRADLAFAKGAMQLPVEVKGQWHPDVWDAASGQLDAQYLVDWRSEQRGIYCVLWFGTMPSSSRRRLRRHPDGAAPPASAQDMRSMLVARIPEARRTFVEVVVFDLVTGRHRQS